MIFSICLGTFLRKVKENDRIFCPIRFPDFSFKKQNTLLRAIPTKMNHAGRSMWGLGLGGYSGMLGLELSGICGGLGLGGHLGTLGLELSGICVGLGLGGDLGTLVLELSGIGGGGGRGGGGGGGEGGRGEI